MILLVLL